MDELVFSGRGVEAGPFPLPSVICGSVALYRNADILSLLNVCRPWSTAIEEIVLGRLADHPRPDARDRLLTFGRCLSWAQQVKVTREKARRVLVRAIFVKSRCCISALIKYRRQTAVTLHDGVSQGR